MKVLIEVLIDAFFPKKCVGCDKMESFLCELCKEKLCTEIFSEWGGGFLDSGTINEFLDELVYVSDYRKCKLMRKLIFLFKYKFANEVGVILATLMLDRIKFLNLDRDSYTLIPIPLDPKRKKYRGFNQSKILASEIVKKLPRWNLSECLGRARNGQSQAGLSKAERAQNIKDLMYFKGDVALEKKKIFLIDDVFTTGSTLNEASKVLRKAGAKWVGGMVLAKRNWEDI